MSQRLGLLGWELEQRMSRDRDLECTVNSHEGLRRLPAMRKRRLDEQLRHEAQGTGPLSRFRLDAE